jgi:vacuolar-type H+-ATPase subunit H
MKILDLMDEIIAEIADSRKTFFSTKKTIDVDFVLEILDEIKEALPQEIIDAQKVLESKQSIINDAKQKAQGILEGVDQRLSEMIEEHRVTQLAYEKSNRMLDIAERQAYEIRTNANDYALNVLDDISSYMREYMDIIQENKSNFINKKNKDQAEF